MGRSSRTKRQRRAEQEQHDPHRGSVPQARPTPVGARHRRLLRQGVEVASDLHRKLAGHPQARDSVFICHGTATGQGPIAGKPLHHAWVEYGEVVIDDSNGHNWVGRKELVLPHG